MKNFNMARIVRILGLIALVAVIGFSFVSCGGGGGGGGGDNNNSNNTKDGNYDFQFWGNQSLFFKDLVYTGDHDQGDLLKNNFTVTVDDNPVSVTGAGNAGGLYIVLSGTYNDGQKYKVKVVYTADPNNPIFLMYPRDKRVDSFQIEKELESKR